MANLKASPKVRLLAWMLDRGSRKSRFDTLKFLPEGAAPTTKGWIRAPWLDQPVDGDSWGREGSGQEVQLATILPEGHGGRTAAAWWCGDQTGITITVDARTPGLSTVRIDREAVKEWLRQTSRKGTKS